MRFPKAFLTVTGLLNGYMLWATMGVSAFWAIRAAPFTDFEMNIRGLFLPLIAVVGILSSLLIAKRNADWLKQLAFSLFGLNIACIFAYIASDAIHLYFVPNSTIFETLNFYRRNPAFILVNIVAANVIGVFVIAIISSVFFSVEKILERIAPATK